jgi:CRISPR-associated endonuclease/helicase Cas3
MDLELKIFAHSVRGSEVSAWEPLALHATAVAQAAAARAAPFGWGPAASALGLLHDIGKASEAFQMYLRAGPTAHTRVDHSTAGARVAQTRYPGGLGRLLAFAVAGHHAGLPDADDLIRRLDPERTLIPDFSRWTESILLPESNDLAKCAALDMRAQPAFSAAFLARMLFSCLVDADFVETERFYAATATAAPEREHFQPISELASRLRKHLSAIRRDDTAVNRLRGRVLDHATEKAALPPGLFTLTVPTGGGKTLTSLSWALEHALNHGLRRVIYVIPYTSIIEQTAGVFRSALGSDADVLEHHANFDWEAALRNSNSAADADSGEGRDGIGKLRRAAENWQAPVIVTTAVQFFESLFANRTSRCRKLHNLAQSVIILDEAQTLPLHLLQPCLAALDQLARNYKTSVVLCTATQPALRTQDGFKLGLNIPCDRELAPDPPMLYSSLKRVHVRRLEGLTDDIVIAERFAKTGQILCIVNSRAHAGALFASIRDLEGAAHLTTLMCARHRRAVLAQVRADLLDQKRVRLVATSLIEAGVDLDFPEVWRAMAGLDQIAQAAGRCNREGSKAEGNVVVFSPADFKPPHELRAAQGEAEGVFGRHTDPLSLAAMNDYFSQLYWTKGEAAFDAATLDGRPYPILAKLKERSATFEFPFATIARAFRLIDEDMAPIIVPWQAGPEDNDARALLRRIAAMERPLRNDLRALQQYVVQVPRRTRDEWLTHGVIDCVHPALGEALLALPNLDRYDPRVGLRLAGPSYRSAEANVM